MDELSSEEVESETLYKKAKGVKVEFNPNIEGAVSYNPSKGKIEVNIRYMMQLTTAKKIR